MIYKYLNQSLSVIKIKLLKNEIEINIFFNMIYKIIFCKMDLSIISFIILQIQMSQAGDSRLSSQLGTERSEQSHLESGNKAVLVSSLSSQWSQLQENNLHNIIRKLKAKYEELKKIQQEKSINQNQILFSLNWGLKTLFNLNSCQNFVEKGKELFSICQQICSCFNESGPKQQKIKQKEENKLQFLESKSFEKKEQVAPTQLKTRRSQKLSQESNNTVNKKEEIKNAKQFQNEEYKITNKENPYLFQSIGNDQIDQKTLSIFNQIFRARSSQRQQEAEVNKDEKLQEVNKQINEGLKNQFKEITMQMNWEKKSFFSVNDTVIKKLYNDDYRKIVSKQPFPSSGICYIKFRVKTRGTIAVGIVPQQSKGGYWVDDRKCEALKYIAFENGGGIIKLSGEELSNNKKIGLQVNQVLQMTFDIDNMKVLFKKQRLGYFEVELPNDFKKRKLYFYLEMKQMNTCIQFL